jgi:hypothetical protein
MTASVHKIVEEFDELSVDEKEEAKELFDKLMIEARREEIRLAGEEARKLYREGKVKFGSAADLLKELNADR